ncbi:LysR family transcriptional regulator [Halocynthiibacter namhaensis]|uniref:LysR substrate-binding domain-containing protein n=1 Tax=Halocynthiibacter namhaensis TaxID=1290553 RepID=UPI00057906AC|nr:LysR family transcriptional regulator [Halocynthiibacter namhaensis]
MIDLKAAEAARILSQHNSFRISAEVMGTSAASFSRYISQAEEYAEQSLFERSRQGIFPTSAGKAFLKMLDDLDESLSQFKANAERLRAGGPSLVNIGSGPLATKTVIAPLIADMLSDFPGFRALINVRASKEPLEALRTGTVDLAVCDLTHTPDLSGLEIKILRKRRTAFWARPQHPLHMQKKVTIADIFSHPVATGHLPKYWRNQIAKLLGDTEAARKHVGHMPQVESDDYALLNNIACRADLICGGMLEDFEQHRKLGLLKEIRTVEDMTWNICAARRDNVRFPALEEFWNRLSDQYCD